MYQYDPTYKSVLSDLSHIDISQPTKWYNDKHAYLEWSKSLKKISRLIHIVLLLFLTTDLLSYGSHYD